MRFLVVPLLLLGATAGLRAGEAQPRPVSAEEIALFRDAMKNSSQDTEHWAYTEVTAIKASKGRAGGETVVRFDPSKPYAEQFAPLKIKGKPPSEKQRQEYRRRGEKRGERVARAAEAARTPGGAPPQLRIGGNHATLDLEHPRVVHEEEGRLAFEVPVQGRRKDIPADKFQVLVLIDKQARRVESVTLRLRESFRLKLVAKVKAGEASMDFTVVDPNFGPVITSMTGSFDVSFLFVPVNGTFTRTRTEWQRVKSYDERFTVKLAPLQLLDF